MTLICAHTKSYTLENNIVHGRHKFYHPRTRHRGERERTKREKQREKEKHTNKGERKKKKLTAP